MTDDPASLVQVRQFGDKSSYVLVGDSSSVLHKYRFFNAHVLEDSENDDPFDDLSVMDFLSL